jgi:diamine N-acetyltransferase
MQFRLAGREDISTIAALEQIPEFQSFVGSWAMEEHLEAFASPDVRYFVAEAANKEIAGFAILRGLASEHHSIELKRIIVKTPGKGLGRQLLQFLLRQVFEEYRAHRFWLDVFETNLRAQHVYQSVGFQRDGLLRDAVCRDGQYYSLFLMSLLENEYRLGKTR